MTNKIICPKCKAVAKEYRNPTPTVDIIISCVTDDGRGGIVLISRKNPPYGWALPGGYVDYGETLEEAAVREAREEVCLEVQLIRQFHSYSDPKRDSRQHNISTVFIACAQGEPKAADDAEQAVIFSQDKLPDNMVFDHRQILDDFLKKRY